MTYYVLSGDQNGTLAIKCIEEIDNHNGTFSYRQESGIILRCTPNGVFEDKPDAPPASAGGPWESYLKTTDGKAIVAERDNNGHTVSYAFPLLQVK